MLNGYADYFKFNMSDGEIALSHFYDQAKSYNPEGLPKTFDEFLLKLKESPDRGHKILEQTLTNSIEVIKDDAYFPVMDEIENSMRKLADIHKGKLPHSGSFVSAMANEYNNLAAPVAAYFDLSEKLNTNIEAVSGELGWMARNSKYILLGGGVLIIYLTINRLVPNINKITQKRLARK